MARNWGTKEWFTYKFVSEDQKHVTSYFAHRKNGYQLYRHKHLLSYLKSTLSQDNTAKMMLDVGCGMGDFSYLVYKQCSFKTCIGVDFVEPMLQAASRRYPEIQFRYSVLPNLVGLKNDSFDLVIASEVLYYLEKDKRNEALKEIFRVLKDGGFLFFSSVLDSGEHYFSDEGAQDLVKSYFRICKIWYEYGRLYKSIFRPIILLDWLRLYIPSGKEAEDSKYAVFIDLFRTPIIGPLLRGLLGFICWGAFPLLRSQSIPRTLNELSKVIPWQRGKTNIAILAKKVIGISKGGVSVK